MSLFMLMQSVGKSSLVHELARSAGRQLIVFHCSAEVSHSTVLNLITGMAATGMHALLLSKVCNL